MARGWLHETIDLIAYGRPYHYIHKEKDAEAGRTPGLRHREVNHEWYQSFGKLWIFSDPFPNWLKNSIGSIKEPEGAEEMMAFCSHDYIDRVWDWDLSSKPKRDRVRKYWEGFFAWLLLNPDILKKWGGVDVFEGAILREVGGATVWEDAPDIRGEYERLIRLVRFILRRDRKLREIIQYYAR